MEINSDYLEKIIAKAFLNDKHFLTLIATVFKSDYFDCPNISHAFEFCTEYLNEYNSIPDKDTIVNSSSEHSDQIKETIEEIQELEFDISGEYDFLVQQTNDYLKEKALKYAIAESIDDVENPEMRNAIRDRIENALIKDIKINLGLHYFEQLGQRLRRLFTLTEHRIPTYFPIFDELINGGFPPLTLNVITAKIHGGKSNTMANFAARQVLHGHNVVIFTLEMSEDAFAQRFDSIYSLLDINRIYLSRNYKDRLVASLREIKETENRGELFIKQFPTGNASIHDFRIYLRELKLRDINIDIIYVDYINIMKSAYNKDRGDLYGAIKSVSEELRALSFEFQCPVVSVSQLNRQGFFTNFNAIEFSHIAESMGIPATADFMCILGIDEDQMTYENEILWKILKSRIGGLVGSVETFYLDKRSLKMYDRSEIDTWIEDATISGDNRDQMEHDETRRRNDE